MKSTIKLGLLCISIMLLAGCASNPAITHAAFTQAVTLGEQIGLETHPEATPYVRAAVPVVCSVANGTNVSPAEIVSALEKAGVTNVTAKIIINGSLALFNVAVSGLITNQTEVRLYAQDLCNGMQAGLPLGNPKHGLTAKVLPPHLK